MKNKTQTQLLNLLTWAIVVISLLPILWMVLSSLRNYSDIADGSQLDAGLPLQWENYRDMWINVDFFNFFKNSLIICGITTVLATISASCAAYALARFRFRGSNSVSIGITVTQVIPGMLFFLQMMRC